MSTRGNREAWLSGWVGLLRDEYAVAGFEVPDKIRVTCGFPARGALSQKRRVLGQCWPATASDDKHFEVFVSPLLNGDTEVAEVVAHEVGHAVAGVKAHHGPGWKKVVRAVGLTGEKTTGPLGAPLTALLSGYVKGAGHYPHARLHHSACGPTKPQTTRMLKCECPRCGYTCRTTAKWLAVGAPLCPTHKIRMPHEADEAEDD